MIISSITETELLWVRRIKKMKVHVMGNSIYIKQYLPWEGILLYDWGSL